MPAAVKWYRSPQMWVELFALFNLGGLAPDLFLAHSTNFFRHPSEYIPLIFSLVSPLVLLPAVVLLGRGRRLTWWRGLGFLVGWGSVVVGIVGLVLHLESQFFQRWTIASLVYAAPFAAPLAYTGIGLLLIMNRMVDFEALEWPLWVIFLALGGFVGNFVFSVTDHAQNGFYRHSEWIPVASSALAVGFMIVPLVVKVDRHFFTFLCCAHAAPGRRRSVGIWSPPACGHLWRRTDTVRPHDLWCAGLRAHALSGFGPARVHRLMGALSAIRTGLVVMSINTVHTAGFKALLA